MGLDNFRGDTAPNDPRWWRTPEHRAPDSEYSDDDRIKDFIASGDPKLLNASAIHTMAATHPDKLAKYLESSPASYYFLTEATRALYPAGLLHLERIHGAENVVVDGARMSVGEKLDITDMQRYRYGDGITRAEEGYTVRTVEAAMSGLEDAMNQKTSRFYLFKINGIVVASVRFDQHDERGQHTEHPSRLYMATVMGDPKIAEGKLAEVNAEAAFRKEQKRGLPINATVKPELAIAEKYLEWGFVAKSTSMYKDLPLLNIEWNPAVGEQYATRMKDSASGLSREEILARGDSLNSDSVHFHVFDLRPDEGPLTRPNLESHAQAFSKYPGMVLTRLYYDPNRGRFCGLYENEVAVEELRQAA